MFVKTNLHIELPLQRMANILVKKNEDQVIVELCKLIEKEAKDAISRNGTFHLGLSGMNMGHPLHPSIISPNGLDFSSI